MIDRRRQRHSSNRLIFSERIPSDLDREELQPAHGVVVGDDDERPSLVRVESDRSVDQLDCHLQVVLELSTENIIINCCATQQELSEKYLSASTRCSSLLSTEKRRFSCQGHQRFPLMV